MIENIPKCPIYRVTTLAVMSRHLSLDVAKLSQCRANVIVMSRHHSYFLIGFHGCRNFENVMSRH